MSGVRYFDDFHVGWTITTAPLVLTEAEIVAFARTYDPQPFHTSEAAAAPTSVGRLIASGWQTAAIAMLAWEIVRQLVERT